MSNMNSHESQSQNVNFNVETHKYEMNSASQQHANSLGLIKTELQCFVCMSSIERNGQIYMPCCKKFTCNSCISKTVKQTGNFRECPQCRKKHKIRALKAHLLSEQISDFYLKSLACQKKSDTGPLNFDVANSQMPDVPSHSTFTEHCADRHGNLYLVLKFDVSAEVNLKLVVGDLEEKQDDQSLVKLLNAVVDKKYVKICHAAKRKAVKERKLVKKRQNKIENEGKNEIVKDNTKSISKAKAVNKSDLSVTSNPENSGRTSILKRKDSLSQRKSVQFVRKEDFHTKIVDRYLTPEMSDSSIEPSPTKAKRKKATPPKRRKKAVVRKVKLQSSKPKKEQINLHTLTFDFTKFQQINDFDDALKDCIKSHEFQNFMMPKSPETISKETSQNSLSSTPTNIKETTEDIVESKESKQMENLPRTRNAKILHAPVDLDAWRNGIKPQPEIHNLVNQPNIEMYSANSHESKLDKCMDYKDEMREEEIKNHGTESIVIVEKEGMENPRPILERFNAEFVCETIVLSTEDEARFMQTPPDMQILDALGFGEILAPEECAQKHVVEDKKVDEVIASQEIITEGDGIEITEYSPITKSKAIAKPKNNNEHLEMQHEIHMQNEYPELGNENPVMAIENPVMAIENPVMGIENPVMAIENPVMENENPEMGNQNPKLENENPKMENVNPEIVNNNAEIENEIPKIALENSEMKNPGLIHENREEPTVNNFQDDVANLEEKLENLDEKVLENEKEEDSPRDFSENVRNEVGECVNVDVENESLFDEGANKCDQHFSLTACDSFGETTRTKIDNILDSLDSLDNEKMHATNGFDVNGGNEAKVCETQDIAANQDKDSGLQLVQSYIQCAEHKIEEEQVNSQLFDPGSQESYVKNESGGFDDTVILNHVQDIRLDDEPNEAARILMQMEVEDSQRDYSMLIMESSVIESQQYQYAPSQMVSDSPRQNIEGNVEECLEMQGDLEPSSFLANICNNSGIGDEIFAGDTLENNCVLSKDVLQDSLNENVQGLNEDNFDDTGETIAYTQGDFEDIVPDSQDHTSKSLSKFELSFRARENANQLGFAKGTNANELEEDAEKRTENKSDVCLFVGSEIHKQHTPMSQLSQLTDFTNQMSQITQLLNSNCDEHQLMNHIITPGNCDTQPVYLLDPIETMEASVDLSDIVVTYSSLAGTLLQKLGDLSRQHKFVILKEPTLRDYDTKITHIIVNIMGESNLKQLNEDVNLGIAEPTKKYFLGICKGKTIVSCKWINQCANSDKIIHPDEFVCDGVFSHWMNEIVKGAPRKAIDRKCLPLTDILTCFVDVIPQLKINNNYKPFLTREEICGGFRGLGAEVVERSILKIAMQQRQRNVCVIVDQGVLESFNEHDLDNRAKVQQIYQDIANEMKVPLVGIRWATQISETMCVVKTPMERFVLAYAMH